MSSAAECKNIKIYLKIIAADGSYVSFFIKRETLIMTIFDIYNYIIAAFGIWCHRIDEMTCSKKRKENMQALIFILTSLRILNGVYWLYDYDGGQL